MEAASYERMALAEALRREETDYRFSFWTYIGWSILTLSLYGDYATYRLVGRRDEHGRRRLAFMSYVWHALAARADALGRRSDVQPGLDNLSRIYAEVEAHERRNKREPALWTILRFILEPVGAYINHFLNDDMRFLDRWETSFAENVEWVLGRLGIDAAIPRRQHLVERRDTVLYVVLTIVTLGLFALYWRYTVMTDGNAHFDEDAAMEDAILRALGVEPAAPAFGPPPAPPIGGQGGLPPSPGPGAPASASPGTPASGPAAPGPAAPEPPASEASAGEPAPPPPEEPGRPPPA